MHLSVDQSVSMMSLAKLHVFFSFLSVAIGELIEYISLLTSNDNLRDIFMNHLKSVLKNFEETGYCDQN